VTSSLMDLDKLAELHGQEFIKEILESFLQESTGLLKQLPESIKRQDTNDVQGLAHQLKGLSAVCTAQGLQELSLQLEIASGNSDWTAAGSIYQSMSNEHARIKQFVEAFLSN
jgi:HPt (histidine-containing phosphotransfer) domain-containing protein